MPRLFKYRVIVDYEGNFIVQKRYTFFYGMQACLMQGEQSAKNEIILKILLCIPIVGSIIIGIHMITAYIMEYANWKTLLPSYKEPLEAVAMIKEEKEKDQLKFKQYLEELDKEKIKTYFTTY